MNGKIWIRKALSACLVAVTIATYSSVSLASSEKIVGEIQVIGKAENGEPPAVKVNGAAAQSGRSIFTSSTVATPANASAIISLGKAGKIELAPNTIMSLSFNESKISGELSAGRVTVLNSTESVNVRTANGKVSELGNRESAEAAATAGAQAQTDDDDGDGSSLLLYAAILGGAATAIVLAATSDNNRIALGGNTTIVSVTR